MMDGKNWRCYRRSKQGNPPFPLASVVRTMSSPDLPAEEKRVKEGRKVGSAQRIFMDEMATAIERFLKSQGVADRGLREQGEGPEKW